MTINKCIVFGFLSLFWCIHCKGQNNPHTLNTLESYSVIANDGNTYSGEIGSLMVLENRDNPNSGYIEIPFFRIKTKSTNPLPPIFVLEGGPGDNPSAMQQLKGIIPQLSLFAGRSDVVLLDQRGNGNSKPSLRCKNSFNLPLDVPLTKESLKRTYRKYIQECSTYWMGEEHDLQGYNVVSMADDIETLRKVLGYEKIMLFGGSFGSHHGLTYMKRYPDRVDRASLDSPEGLQHTVKLPYEVDKVLVQLSELVKEDPVLSKKIPSFINLVQQTLNSLEKNPIKANVLHPETKKRSKSYLENSIYN